MCEVAGREDIVSTAVNALQSILMITACHGVCCWQFGRCVLSKFARIVPGVSAWRSTGPLNVLLLAAT